MGTTDRVSRSRRGRHAVLLAALLTAGVAAPASAAGDVGAAPSTIAGPSAAVPASGEAQPPPTRPDGLDPMLAAEGRLPAATDLPTVLAAEVERAWGARPLVLTAGGQSTSAVEAGGPFTLALPSGYDADGDGEDDVRSWRTTSGGATQELRSGAGGQVLWQRTTQQPLPSVVASFPARDLTGDGTVDLVELDQRRTDELRQCTAGPCTIRVAVAWQVRVVDGRTGATVWELASTGRDDADGVFSPGYSRFEERRTNALPLPVPVSDADGDALPDLVVPTTDLTSRSERRTVQGPVTTVVDGSGAMTSSLQATVVSGLTGGSLASSQPVLADGTSVLRPAGDLAGTPGSDAVVLTRTLRPGTYTCVYAVPPAGRPLEVCPDEDVNDFAVDIGVLDGRTAALLHRTVVDERNQTGSLAVDAQHDLDGNGRADLLVTLSGAPTAGGVSVVMARSGLDGSARWEHAVAELALPARYVPRGPGGGAAVVLESRERRYVFATGSESLRMAHDVLDAASGEVRSSHRVVLPRARRSADSLAGEAPAVDLTGDGVADPVLSSATADCDSDGCTWSSLLQVRDGRDLHRLLLDVTSPGARVVVGAARLTADAPYHLLVGGGGDRPVGTPRDTAGAESLSAVAADGSVAWTLPAVDGVGVLAATRRGAHDLLLRDQHTEGGRVLARLQRLDGASLDSRWSVSSPCGFPLTCRRD